MLISAVRVVTARNLVHAVLWLAVTLSSTAVLFVLAAAPFLAGIQLLLYTGGVITLMLFGVMLTRRHEGMLIENETVPPRRTVGLVIAAVVFGTLAGATFTTEGLSKPPLPVAEDQLQQIGRSFLTEHLLAFEVLSLLLLAAMIGAIVLARREDYGRETSVRDRLLAARAKASASEPAPSSSRERHASIPPAPPPVPGEEGSRG